MIMNLHSQDLSLGVGGQGEPCCLKYLSTLFSKPDRCMGFE